MPADQPSRTDKVVFGVTAGLTLAFVLWGAVATDSLESVSSSLLEGLIHNFGWAFMLAASGGGIGRVDDDLPWGNACRRTPGYLEVQRATCYGRLGLGREAEQLWSQVLDAVPATARRDRGVYLARYATAAAGARQPEQAVEIARAATEIATETRSARMLRELRVLERAMRPWHDAPVGRDLAEVLAPVNEGS